MSVTAGFDLNNAVTATGLIAAAFATFRNRRTAIRKIDKVHDKVENTHGDVEEVAKQVRNGYNEEGKTLHELVHEIERQNERILRFWEYQRTRNHDIGNAVTRTEGKAEEHTELLTRILAVLETISEHYANQQATGSSGGSADDPSS